MEFEKTKKEFIVDEEEYSKGQLSLLMSQLLKFCKVTKNGQVMVIKKVSTRKILKLILSAKFIAHKADKTIVGNVTREELKVYSGMKDNVFTARFNELLKENFVDKKENKLSAKNILLVEQFLQSLKG